jgi:hypothetical protein
MKIIAFGHRKLSGKNTAVKFYATEYRLRHRGSNVICKGFADKLKDICYQLYKWAGVKYLEYYENNPSAKETYLPKIGMTVRQLWIQVGNRLRDIYDDTWINYLLHSYRDTADLLLISDLRYPNEAKAIHDLGGYCIRIDRYNENINYNDEADIAMNHYNEWDAILDNNGTYSQLYDNVIKICDSLG